MGSGGAHRLLGWIDRLNGVVLYGSDPHTAAEMRRQWSSHLHHLAEDPLVSTPQLIAIATKSAATHVCWRTLAGPPTPVAVGGSVAVCGVVLLAVATLPTANAAAFVVLAVAAFVGGTVLVTEASAVDRSLRRRFVWAVSSVAVFGAAAVLGAQPRYTPDSIAAVGLFFVAGTCARWATTATSIHRDARPWFALGTGLLLLSAASYGAAIVWPGLVGRTSALALFILEGSAGLGILRHTRRIHQQHGRKVHHT